KVVNGFSLIEIPMSNCFVIVWFKNLHNVTFTFCHTHPTKRGKFQSSRSFESCVCQTRQEEKKKGLNPQLSYFSNFSQDKKTFQQLFTRQGKKKVKKENTQKKRKKRKKTTKKTMRCQSKTKWKKKPSGNPIKIYK
ncbi:hypothetical protein RFI_31927, partial [Reticulomyxa filosa]